MKVILLQDVAKIGGRFETVEVPNGYAQNKLIPQGQAMPATPANAKKVAARRERAAAAAATAEASFADALTKLSGETLTVHAKSNDQGHLYEALHARDIVAAAAAVGAALTESQVQLPEQIKAVGSYEISLTDGAQTGVIAVTVAAA